MTVHLSPSYGPYWHHVYPMGQLQLPRVGGPGQGSGLGLFAKDSSDQRAGPPMTSVRRLCRLWKAAYRNRSGSGSQENGPWLLCKLCPSPEKTDETKASRRGCLFKSLSNLVLVSCPLGDLFQPTL